MSPLLGSRVKIRLHVGPPQHQDYYAAASVNVTEIIIVDNYKLSYYYYHLH